MLSGTKDILLRVLGKNYESWVGPPSTAATTNTAYKGIQGILYYFAWGNKLTRTFCLYKVNNLCQFLLV